MRILGIDPSLTNLGYVVLEGDTENRQILEKGKLQTVPTDGLYIQRYVKQCNGISELVKKYNIKHVASEAPYMMDHNTEVLFGLQSFLHFTYWIHKLNVVIFPPTQIKGYALPEFKGSGEKIFKEDMVKAARKDLNMRENERLANDVADAYWVSKLGLRFWLYYSKVLPEQLLTEDERRIFTKTHTYTRGKKKGFTERTGIIYRKNEMFYIYGEMIAPDKRFLIGE